MSLVCNATTPEEFRKEIVSLLHHRAAQERAVIGITSNSKRDALKHEHAATALDYLAHDIERMEIVNAWPSGLRETPEHQKGNLCVSCFAPISKGERFCAPCDPRE
jgi:hypothetical protein